MLDGFFKTAVGRKTLLAGRLFFILGLTPLFGCLLEGPQDCPSVSQDQQGSFMAKVTAYPITILVDMDFTPDQRQGVIEAVNQWNQYGQQQIHQNLFSLRYTTVLPWMESLNPADCEQDFGSAGDFYLIRESSEAHWKSIGLGKNIPAATFRCERGSQVARQVIFTYPDVVDSSQFSSVILHELGHSIGLDHSCLGDLSKNRDDYRSCLGLEASHAYREAVMYPWLQVVSGTNRAYQTPEIKNTLRSNDQLRAQCVMSSS